MKKCAALLVVISLILSGALAQSEPVATTITMTFGGDCVLGTRKTYKTGPDTFDTYMEEKGYEWPFRNLLAIFSKDDLTYVNLEGVLQDNEEGYYKKEYSFRGLTDYAKILPLSSIEHVNIANNHFGDYRKAGEASTLAALEAVNIPYSGFRNTYVYEKDGIKIGFAGCRETVYKETPRTVQNDIKDLKALGCDAIIYSFHWGKEYSPTHNKLQQNMADYAIKQGANIVMGTHPHCIQGIDYRNNGLVIYSLGNLIFGGTLDMTTFDAILTQLELKFENGIYKGVNLRILPVLTSGSIPKNDFSPVFAEGEDYRRIMQLVQDDSPFPVSSDMWFAVEESKKRK